jgi:hypothetical protein
MEKEESSSENDSDSGSDSSTSVLDFMAGFSEEQKVVALYVGEWVGSLAGASEGVPE